MGSLQHAAVLAVGICQASLIAKSTLVRTELRPWLITWLHTTSDRMSVALRGSFHAVVGLAQPILQSTPSMVSTSQRRGASLGACLQRGGLPGRRTPRARALLRIRPPPARAARCRSARRRRGSRPSAAPHPCPAARQPACEADACGPACPWPTRLVPVRESSHAD